MKSIVIVAPHPDDEVLGCGGTILKHIDNGDEVHWIIVSGMDTKSFSKEQIKKRSDEITKVSKLFGFKSTYKLDYPTSKLDQIPKNEIINKFGNLFESLRAEVIYTVFRNDAHSDHKVVFDSVVSATKSFRCPSVKKLLSFETISETDFSNPMKDPFRPNLFINIEDYIEKKIEIMKVYESEMGEFPFPRSREAIIALSSIRGVQSRCKAAEAFILIKEIS